MSSSFATRDTAGVNLTSEELEKLRSLLDTLAPSPNIGYFPTVFSGISSQSSQPSPCFSSVSNVPDKALCDN